MNLYVLCWFAFSLFFLRGGISKGELVGSNSYRASCEGPVRRAPALLRGGRLGVPSPQPGAQGQLRLAGVGLGGILHVAGESKGSKH